jgi:hypothetical protein
MICRRSFTSAFCFILACMVLLLVTGNLLIRMVSAEGIEPSTY